ncbi:MAG: SGNH/GDSL hydrolase family protein [Ruminococcaceae bacterium]|nr:SGNH/GDSL hydrolase family protein [Oscillospiraceae bacterium]
MNMDQYLKDLFDENEKPLDRFPQDGGYCGIFRTWGMIGDSLASGEFEGTRADGSKSYHDYYDYSWGQYFARMTGTTARNFSQGGMTAKAYCESFADSKGFWNKGLACSAYVMALGVNDLFNQDHEFGSIDDICMDDWRQNKSTFVGDYARIIQRYREIEPDSRFFLMTFPNQSDRDEKRRAQAIVHRDLLYKLSMIFPNIYVLDYMQYGPDYANPEFRKNFFLGGHLSPVGYMFTAKILVSYVDYIIRHNMSDFKQVGFIGTPYKNAIDV